MSDGMSDTPGAGFEFVGWYRVRFECGCEILTRTTLNMVSDVKWRCSVHHVKESETYWLNKGEEALEWLLISGRLDTFPDRPAFPHEIKISTLDLDADQSWMIDAQELAETQASRRKREVSFIANALLYLEAPQSFRDQCNYREPHNQLEFFRRRVAEATPKTLAEARKAIATAVTLERLPRGLGDAKK
jgi:hypothetical protein